MKKVGIVADNYKLEQFKNELTKAGFTDFDIKPCAPNMSAIYVNVEDNQVKDITNICTKVELHFKRSN
jgi:hypothetical protein